jgi:hypothetical protein
MFAVYFYLSRENNDAKNCLRKVALSRSKKYLIFVIFVQKETAIGLDYCFVLIIRTGINLDIFLYISQQRFDLKIKVIKVRNAVAVLNKVRRVISHNIILRIIQNFFQHVLTCFTAYSLQRFGVGML